MYQLKIDDFGGFDRYTFGNEATGNSFSIVPSFGATLVSLRFSGREVLDGYQTGADLVANKWSKSAILCPFPNRLEDGQYNIGGKAYQFPLNNAATGNAIHGFMKDKPMDVIYTDSTEKRSIIACSYRYEGSYAPYPFPFYLTVIAEMTGVSGDFRLYMLMANMEKGADAFPAGLGWHPYFRLSDRVDELWLQMPPICEKIAVNDRMLPTGERTPFDDFVAERLIGDAVLDNCFVVPNTEGRAIVTLRNKHGKLRYWQETGVEKSNFVQVFTPPHRESIAIEPMTCNVNAFRNGDGLVMLDNEKRLVCECGLSWVENP